MLFKLFVALLLTNQVLAFQQAKLEFQDLWGDPTFPITGENDEQSVTCLAKGDPDPKGEFRWKLDGKVVNANLLEDKDLTEKSSLIHSSTYTYSPKIEDNGKTLSCGYVQEPNGEFKETITELTLNIAKYILPKSPYVVQGQQKLNGQVIITLDLELYPEPESQNLGWVIESKTTGEKLELPPGSEEERFKADVESLGNDKHQAILTIDPLLEEDVTKEIYFLIKASEEERRIDVQFTLEKDITTVVPDTTTTPEVQTSSTGLYIIIALVVLIILACIAFCVYKQCYKKPEPRSSTDAEKGPYQKAPQSDPDAAAAEATQK